MSRANCRTSVREKLIRSAYPGGCLFQASQTNGGFAPERFAIGLAESCWVEAITIVQTEQLLKGLSDVEEGRFSSRTHKPY